MIIHLSFKFNNLTVQYSYMYVAPSTLNFAICELHNYLLEITLAVVAYLLGTP